jgi:hypothetical protein
VELLPYHAIAAGKYAGLGRENPVGELKPPGVEHLQRCAEILRECGIVVIKVT